MTEKLEIPLDIPDVKMIKTGINRIGDFIITNSFAYLSKKRFNGLD